MRTPTCLAVMALAATTVTADYVNYTYSPDWKTFVVLDVGAPVKPGVDGGVSLMIDADDLLGYSPDGQAGWVTVWLGGDIGGGIGGCLLPLEVAVARKPVSGLDLHGAPLRGNYDPPADVLAASIDMSGKVGPGKLTVSSSGDVTLGVSANLCASGSLEVGTDLLRFEVRRPKLVDDITHFVQGKCGSTGNCDFMRDAILLAVAKEVALATLLHKRPEQILGGYLAAADYRDPYCDGASCDSLVRQATFEERLAHLGEELEKADGYAGAAKFLDPIPISYSDFPRGDYYRNKIVRKIYARTNRTLWYKVFLNRGNRIRFDAATWYENAPPETHLEIHRDLEVLINDVFYDGRKDRGATLLAEAKSVIATIPELVAPYTGSYWVRLRFEGPYCGAVCTQHFGGLMLTDLAPPSLPPALPSSEAGPLPADEPTAPTASLDTVAPPNQTQRKGPPALRAAGAGGGSPTSSDGELPAAVQSISPSSAETCIGAKKFCESNGCHWLASQYSLDAQLFWRDELHNYPAEGFAWPDNSNGLIAGSLLHFTNIYAGGRVEWKFYRPGGAYYGSVTYDIPSPSSYGWSYWIWYDVAGGYYINYSGSTAMEPGLWRIDVYVDGTRKLTQSFAVNDAPVITTPPDGSSISRDWSDGTVALRLGGVTAIPEGSDVQFELQGVTSDVDATHKLQTPPFVWDVNLKDLREGSHTVRAYVNSSSKHGDRYAPTARFDLVRPLLDGGFEAGAGWAPALVGGNLAPRVELHASDGPYSGNYYLKLTNLLGNMGTERAAFVRQSFSVPGTATTLNYTVKYWKNTWGACIGVRLDGNVLESYCPGGQAVSSSWTYRSFGITAYRGQTVTLEIFLDDRNGTWSGNGDHGAWIGVDNVSLGSTLGNGSFESSGGWTIEAVGGSLAPSINLQATDGPYMGSRYGKITNTLGSMGVERAGFIRQSFSVPGTATTLNYAIKYWKNTWGACVGVKLNGNVLESYCPGGQAVSSGWTYRSFGITAYRGQSVTLEIFLDDRNGTWSGNGDHGAWIGVDDVSVQ